jgi:hypothetical protein
MSPAFIALTNAAAAYVEAVRIQDAAEHLHRIRMLSRSPDSVIQNALGEWNAATAEAREAYHVLAEATEMAKRELAAATVPDPESPRLPLVVEMAVYARQAEMRRRFEKDCG